MVLESQKCQRNPSTLMSRIVQRFRKPTVSTQLVPNIYLSNNIDTSSMWINWHFLRPKKSLTIPIQHKCPFCAGNHLSEAAVKSFTSSVQNINSIKDYFATHEASLNTQNWWFQLWMLLVSEWLRQYLNIEYEKLFFFLNVSEHCHYSPSKIKNKTLSLITTKKYITS